MRMTAVALSSFLPMWHHRLEAVLALLRGEPGQQVAERFRMTRSDLYKFRARALQALCYALLDQPRGPKRPHHRLAADREEAVIQSWHQHPTWSARQLHEHLGDEAPHPRTIDRIRQRHGLTRQSSVPSLRGLFRDSPPKSRRKPATSSRPIRHSDRTGWRGTWTAHRASACVPPR
jgi:hypothetical protein